MCTLVAASLSNAPRLYFLSLPQTTSLRPQDSTNSSSSGVDLDYGALLSPSDFEMFYSPSSFEMSGSGSPGRGGVMADDKSPSKTLQCGVCGQSFTGRKRSFMLKRHAMIHTGEKPFQCPHCSHSCNRKENLQLHVYLKHTSRKAPANQSA